MNTLTAVRRGEIARIDGSGPGAQRLLGDQPAQAVDDLADQRDGRVVAEASMAGCGRTVAVPRCTGVRRPVRYTAIGNPLYMVEPGPTGLVGHLDDTEPMPMQREPELNNAALMTAAAAGARGVGQAPRDLRRPREERRSLGRRWPTLRRLCRRHRGAEHRPPHPDIVDAVKAQLDLFTHTCFQVLAYEPTWRLAERLNARPGQLREEEPVPDHRRRAVENAVKIARAYTGALGIVAFTGGYHGRTIMTLGLTGKVAPYKTGFGPFPGEVFHALYPRTLHGVSVADALHSVELIFKNDIEASRVAAFIVEPVQGEGGFYIAPPEFIAGLKAIADRHGILLIADEVQTGAGRTGTWFASEQWPVAPDLITTAKSMAGGFPISGVVGRAEVMDARRPAAWAALRRQPAGLRCRLAVLRVFEGESGCSTAPGQWASACWPACARSPAKCRPSSTCAAWARWSRSSLPERRSGAARRRADQGRRRSRPPRVDPAVAAAPRPT